ncbi:MAG: NAD(P)-dependent oxidoreductase [Planctomycetota bacterium]|nr:NAD(P)-dependent oxidoreductase [Planctomycetota bacterium]
MSRASGNNGEEERDVTPTDVATLEEHLSRPTPQVVDELAPLDGDLLILGAGGKMGPSLARMARRALDQAGSTSRVIAVARFSNPDLEAPLGAEGIDTHRADLLDPEQVKGLPDAGAMLFLAGQKFGTTDDPAATWAMNAQMPERVAERYGGVRTVVFSSGNVYPLVDVGSGGATEDTPPAPVGEYARSVLARERAFEAASRDLGTPVTQFRLNYAVDLRYGVLVDIARKVKNGDPIDLTMGYANVIWQGDANAMALRSLNLATSPPTVINVTGLERVCVRDVATGFGEQFGRSPRLTGQEQPTALLSSAARAHELLGPATMPLDDLIQHVAEWVGNDGESWDLPTHFESRDGVF